MEAVVRTILKHLALSGLVVSFAVLALRSRTVRDTFARTLSFWRSLTAFGRVAVCLFLLVGVLVGGDKTNGVPPNMNAPLVQIQNLGGSFQTGFTGLTGLPGAGNLVNPVNPVKNNNSVQKHSAQYLFAAWKAANWNVRGAWKDSFWFPFEDGWVFPRGTNNHLSGVEVVAQGDVWATPFGDTVASIGFPVEIVRGLTTFGCGHTPSNTYVFAWRDAAVGRDTDNLASASIELFRNGDIATTTNGVVQVLPRELPFPHDGFGQDEDWVRANFTNAEEILSVGYPAWVDAFAMAETNGLYKFTVSFASMPPETLRLGGFSVHEFVLHDANSCFSASHGG